MILPNVQRAHVPLAELAASSLGPTSPEGTLKAGVLRSALGQEDAEWLRSQVLTTVLDTPAVESPPSPYGSRYVVDFGPTTDVGSAAVRTTRIVRADETFPRLTPCHVL